MSGLSKVTVTLALCTRHLVLYPGKSGLEELSEHTVPSRHQLTLLLQLFGCLHSPGRETEALGQDPTRGHIS